MRFRINGEEWTVKQASPNHPMLMRIDGSYAFAACDDESKSIYISEYVETKSKNFEEFN